jgi:hypothetical protein
LFKLYGGTKGMWRIIKQTGSVLYPVDEAFVRTVFSFKKKIWYVASNPVGTTYWQ